MAEVRFECVGTTDSMMLRNVRRCELCNERIAASQDDVAECSVTELIGRI